MWARRGAGRCSAAGHGQVNEVRSRGNQRGRAQRPRGGRDRGRRAQDPPLGARPERQNQGAAGGNEGEAHADQVMRRMTRGTVRDGGRHAGSGELSAPGLCVLFARRFCAVAGAVVRHPRRRRRRRTRQEVHGHDAYRQERRYEEQPEVTGRVALPTPPHAHAPQGTRRVADRASGWHLPAVTARSAPAVPRWPGAPRAARGPASRTGPPPGPRLRAPLLAPARPRRVRA